MKLSVKERGKKFEPITLTLVIETREELLDMYVRHIITNEDVKKIVGNPGWVEYNDGLKAAGTSALLNAIDDIPNDYKDIPLLVALEKEILK